MARIDRYFEQLRAVGASDLHLSSGKGPLIRSSGHVAPMANETVLSDTELRDLLKEITSQQQWERFEQEHDLDFAITVPNVARFRANYFEQEHGMGAVFRMIPEDIISIDKLGLPEVVHGLAELESGLVLVTGPTGSGKSTTLAAIVDLINRTHVKHLVTIEDPVEFVHGNKRSVLSHREVGTHSNDFGSALKAALRQDADVILVGEMRDLETISLALEAASMGVLVFGTLHTNSAAKTIDRIIDSFPTDRQDQARGSLADSLVAVVAQILVRRKEGGRVGVHEILVRTPGLSGAIREGNTAMINSIIGSGRGQGMQTMDGALMELVRTNVIDGHEAYLKAADKKLFLQWAEGSAH
jgi:twitching motility protein PilT